MSEEETTQAEELSNAVSLEEIANRVRPYTPPTDEELTQALALDVVNRVRSFYRDSDNTKDRPEFTQLQDRIVSLCRKYI